MTGVNQQNNTTATSDFFNKIVHDQTSHCRRRSECRRSELLVQAVRIVEQCYEGSCRFHSAHSLRSFVVHLA